MSNTRDQIIRLIEDLQETPTVHKRLKLHRLALKYAIEHKVNLETAFVLEVVDHGIYSKGVDNIEYIFNAHVWYLNQVFHVYITGVVHCKEIHQGSEGDWFNAPYAPEYRLDHGWFNDILVTLSGDPNEEPVPLPEKVLTDIALQYVEGEDYQELVH